jgi:DNA-binding HxlR family transcriptional regulator
MNRRLRHLVRAWRPDTRPPHVERDLTARLEHLESVVEGLQDAIYRQAQQYDKDIADLRKRTDPAELARTLSADARRRGL